MSLLSSDVLGIEMVDILSKSDDEIRITSSLYSFLMYFGLTSVCVSITTSLGAHFSELLLLTFLFILSLIECLLEEACLFHSLATDSLCFWMLRRGGKAARFASWPSFSPSKSFWTEQESNWHHHLTAVEQP